MKKRGFTLVEMLAVLVLVVAISLVVFPSIIKYINSTKGDISSVTKELILSNAKLYVEDNKSIFLERKKNIYCPTIGDLIDNNYLDSSIKDAATGKELDRNKKIKVSFEYDSDLQINRFTYDLDDSCVPNEVLCRAVTELSTQNYYIYENNKYVLKEGKTGVLASEAGPYAYGVEYTCELGDNDKKTFYVLEENGDKVSLIMNMNIDSNGKGTTSGNTVAWISKEDYIASGGEINENDGGDCQYGLYCAKSEYGPITANNYLKNSTTNWTKLNQSQISMPTGEQIAKAGGDTEWDDGNYTRTVLSRWLYENLYVNNSAPYSYWTSTPYASNSYYVWLVYYDGTLLNYSPVYDGISDGVRPVITISKSNLG